jgi:hypothetical protein
MLNDVFGFPDYPLLYFENGIPTQFGLFVDPGNNGGILGGNNGLMFGDPGAFFFIVENQISGEGSVTLEINNSTV